MSHDHVEVALLYDPGLWHSETSMSLQRASKHLCVPEAARRCSPGRRCLDATSHLYSSNGALVALESYVHPICSSCRAPGRAHDVALFYIVAFIVASKVFPDGSSAVEPLWLLVAVSSMLLLE